MYNHRNNSSVTEEDCVWLAHIATFRHLKNYDFSELFKKMSDVGKRIATLILDSSKTKGLSEQELKSAIGYCNWTGKTIILDNKTNTKQYQLRDHEEQL